MLDGNHRDTIGRFTNPVGKALTRIGVNADVMTVTGLISASLTAWAIAAGWHLAAVALLTLTGAHDLFDGAVAKASGSASLRGAYLDSVTDRVSDTVLMLGCSWYLTANDHGQWALLPLIILGASAAISYQRAKAESLGIAAKGGLMERAERMILLGAGLLIPGIFIPVLIALALLSIGTAIGRFFRIYRVIEGPEGTSFQDLVEAGHKDRTGVAERIFATPLPTEVMRQRRRRPSRRDATWRARRFERRPQASKARRTWSARRDASSTPRSRRP